MSKAIFQAIIAEQLDRIKKDSAKRHLDIEEIRALDLLLRSWKTLAKEGDELEDPLEGLSKKEKIALAKMEI